MKRPEPQPIAIACFAAMIVLTAGKVAPGAASRNMRKPGIGYAYPAGGKQGTTFELKLAGRYLDGVSGAVVSGGDVKATVVRHVKPLNGKEINLLRDRLKELQAKLKGTNTGSSAVKAAADSPQTTSRAQMLAEINQIKEKLANPKNRNRENPQLGEDVVLKVTIAPDARPGPRQLRLRTTAGLSNPVAFHVSQLSEYTEQEPNNRQADTGAASILPVVINGQIMPGDVDRFALKLKRGQKLVALASARELVPYLADAVPGWFQATLALYDSHGNEVAYDDDYRFNPDPVLLYEVPSDGEYVIEIKDAIYRGREDFVYRITVGELPFITSMFPLGGPAGQKTTVRLKGWNLPTETLTIEPKGRSSGTIPVRVRSGKIVSNAIPFAVDDLREAREIEPNNRQVGAQRLTLPLIVNGRIDSPTDQDVFRFQGRAGQKIVAEVLARHLNSPLDSVLKLMDSSGRKLAINDDSEDKAAGLMTHHADSFLAATLPADGTYYLCLTDAQAKGSEEYAYRLRVSPPRPDFELRVVPSTINARAGGTVPVTVYAMRRDGFAGTITLKLKDAPAGLALSNNRLWAGKDFIRTALRIPPNCPREPFTLQIQGSAQIGQRTVVHDAVPADDMMQAFIYHHLVPAEDLRIAVVGRVRTPARKPQATTTRRPAVKKPTSAPTRRPPAKKPATTPRKRKPAGKAAPATRKPSVKKPT